MPMGPDPTPCGAQPRKPEKPPPQASQPAASAGSKDGGFAYAGAPSQWKVLVLTEANLAPALQAPRGDTLPLETGREGGELLPSGHGKSRYVKLLHGVLH